MREEKYARRRANVRCQWHNAVTTEWMGMHVGWIGAMLARRGESGELSIQVSNDAFLFSKQTQHTGRAHPSLRRRVYFEDSYKCTYE